MSKFCHVDFSPFARLVFNLGPAFLGMASLICWVLCRRIRKVRRHNVFLLQFHLSCSTLYFLGHDRVANIRLRVLGHQQPVAFWAWNLHESPPFILPVMFFHMMPFRRTLPAPVPIPAAEHPPHEPSHEEGPSDVEAQDQQIS